MFIIYFRKRFAKARDLTASSNLYNRDNFRIGVVLGPVGLELGLAI